MENELEGAETRDKKTSLILTVVQAKNKEETKIGFWGMNMRTVRIIFNTMTVRLGC